METILIRLQPGPLEDKEPPAAQWLIVGNNRLPIGSGGTGTLEEASNAARQRRVVILAPSEDILLTRVTVKARNREQLLRAIPFALEEDLAEDVEQLHFAPGPRQSDGSHPVAVVAHAHMTQWFAQLNSVGLIAQAVIPDVLAVPQAGDNAWSLLLERDRAWIRTGAFGGFTLEPDNLETLLACALEEAAVKPAHIEVYGAESEYDPRLPEIEPITYVHREGHAPQIWAAGLHERSSINLLQGQYRTKSDIGRMFKPWRAAAVLLAAWIVLQAVEIGLDYRRLAAENRRLQVEIEQVYRQTFPNATRIVNPRVQMEQELLALREVSASGDSRAAFMPLLDAGVRAIQGHAGVDIETLDYMSGRLELSLSARELQALEAIKQAVESEALAAEIESAETSGATVSGRLAIQEARG
ncbi:MAG: type II secretion system protein GspL [Pseudomonadota bacterium]|nr:type II secretion system protein GspL [Pseudomonadota bacterium]